MLFLNCPWAPFQIPVDSWYWFKPFLPTPASSPPLSCPSSLLFFIHYFVVLLRSPRGKAFFFSLNERKRTEGRNLMTRVKFSYFVVESTVVQRNSGQQKKIYILGLEDCIRFLQRKTHFLFCYLCVIVRCQHGFNHTWICVEYEWMCFFFKQKGRIDSNSVKKLVWCTDAVLHFPDRGIKWWQLCCSFFISAEWVLSPSPVYFSVCPHPLPFTPSPSLLASSHCQTV